MLKYAYYNKGVVNMKNIEIVDMYNNGKLLVQISEELGVSKRSVQRRLSHLGFQYDRLEKKNIKVLENIEGLEETKTNKNVIINRTFALPQNISIALKLKATLEGKTVTNILKDILQNAIEPKYFNMK
jgi:hypothetical protein